MKNLAGIAINDENISFVELGENHDVVKKIRVELPPHTVENGIIKNFDALKESFSLLQNLTGKITAPVVCGLPARELIIQPVNLPSMTLEDIHGVIATNFEEYFNFPKSEALFDILNVKTPAGFQVLAIATRKQTVKNLLEAAKNFPIVAIEPENLATLRAVSSLREGLCVFATPQNIAATWQGTPIFFRATDAENHEGDIANTLRYITTQYSRNATVTKIILSGMQITNPEIETESISDEYLTAKGLAMRGKNDFLNFLPSEFAKRKIFSLDRLFFSGLLAGFLILSVGTVIFSRFQSENLQREIYALMNANENFLRRQSEISASNAKLEREKNHLEKIFAFVKKDLPVLEIMNAIEESAEKIKLDSAEFSQGDIILNGTGENDNAVLALTEGLKASGIFYDVALPISQKDKSGRIIFRISAKAGEIL